MFSRREFLRTSSRTSTLVALAPTIPGFLAQTARAAGPVRDGRILVVVQLNGGNDGINTVVPFADEGYAKNRNVLRLPTNRLLRINREVALHPAMGDAARLLQSGRLAIVQGVGYPNPSRSHFKSMAIWHTAHVNLPRTDRLDMPTNASLGWIGRALDEGGRSAGGSPAAQFVGSESLPLALRSRRSVASAIMRPEDAVLTLRTGERTTPSMEGGRGDDLAAFVLRSTLDAYDTSERMARLLRTEDRGVSYPTNEFAGQLRLVARLIKSGGGTRIYYTSQGYYDTHYDQLQVHANLLGELSGALKAFLDDLAGARLADRVVVLCFSEFGRRVRENGSRGTDHGTAGPVFLAGPRVRAGLAGRTPSLLDLEDGDLRMGIDFRRVYATILEEWLGLPSNNVLGARFEQLPLFRA
jgi:uncharacterized protein (DUF1501 family)